MGKMVGGWGWKMRGGEEVGWLSHHHDQSTKTTHNRSKHHHHHHAPPAPPLTTTQAAAAGGGDTQAEEEEAVEEEEEAAEPAPVLLVGVPRVYSCGACRTHLASDMDVVSRVRVCDSGGVFLLFLVCCGGVGVL